MTFKFSHAVVGLAVVGFGMFAVPVLIYCYETFNTLKVTSGVGVVLLIVALVMSCALETNPGEHRDTNEIE